MGNATLDRDDLSGLRVEMGAFVGELLKKHADKVWEDQDWRMDVTDESGVILYILHITATDSAAPTSDDSQSAEHYSG